MDEIKSCVGGGGKPLGRTSTVGPSEIREEAKELHVSVTIEKGTPPKGLRRGESVRSRLGSMREEGRNQLTENNKASTSHHKSNFTLLSGRGFFCKKQGLRECI